jgi:uncharacterized protein (UPF0276 family)
MKLFEYKPIPIAVGIGFKPQHFQEIIRNKPKVSWFEIHSENYFCDGGMNKHILEELRSHYPVSFHGVGLSLGSADGIKKEHLKKLKDTIDYFQPALVSEHISWSNHGKQTLNDLLPLPYTREALNILANNIETVQEALKRTILVENPSTYLEFESSEMSEAAFIGELTKKSGCDILLDVNNIYVNHINHGYQLEDYLQAIPPGRIKEIHLAGHLEVEIEEEKILIDHHGDSVSEKVWEFYQQTLTHIGAKPTLIEWDTNIPPLDEWLSEAKKATKILDRHA